MFIVYIKGRLFWITCHCLSSSVGLSIKEQTLISISVIFLRLTRLVIAIGLLVLSGKTSKNIDSCMSGTSQLFSVLFSDIVDKVARNWTRN